MIDKDIEHYVESIKSKLLHKKAIYLRGQQNKNGDIDFYVKRKDLKYIEKFLLRESFFPMCNSKNSVSYFKYVSGDLIIIDIELAFDYVFHKIGKVSFRNDFIKRYLENPQDNKVPFNSIRYLFLERQKPKYIQFFKNFYSEILKENFYLFETLSENPFKNNFSSRKLLNSILSQKNICIFRYLKVKYKLHYIKNWILRCVKILNRGKTFAFIGADGVGKTTLIQLLSKIKNSRNYYMGTNHFIFQNLFQILHKNNTIINKLLRVFLIYIENWIKWIKVSFNVFVGRNVFLDRHPSYQYFLQNRYGYYLNKILYQYLFPKPDKIIILHAPISLILQRKNEHNIYIIEHIYRCFHRHLERQKNVHWVENIDINTTLGCIVKIIEEEK